MSDEEKVYRDQIIERAIEIAVKEKAKELVDGAACVIDGDDEECERRLNRRYTNDYEKMKGKKRNVNVKDIPDEDFKNPRSQDGDLYEIIDKTLDELEDEIEGKAYKMNVEYITEFLTKYETKFSGMHRLVERFAAKIRTIDPEYKGEENEDEE
jgi:hypothetical protein